MNPSDRLFFTRSRGAVALVALVAVGLSAWISASKIFAPPPTNFDDAYMYVRYAKQILAGHGHAWNPDGVQTFGSTNTLYLGFVLPLRGLTSLTDAGILRLLSGSFGAGALAVMVITAWRFTGAPTRFRNLLLWAGLIVPPIACSDIFTFHGRTGMGTTLALFTNSVLIYCTLRMLALATTRSVLPVVIAAYLTYLARPDNALLAGLVPIGAILLVMPRPSKKKMLVRFCAGLGLFLAVDLSVKLAVFGSPLPLSVFAKTQGHLGEYAGAAQWNALAFLFDFLGLALPFLCVIAAFAGRRHLLMIATLLVPVALTLAVHFGTLQIMGYQARFSFPTLPFFVASAALALGHFTLLFGSREEGTCARLSGKALASRLLVVFAVALLLPAADAALTPVYTRHLKESTPAPAKTWNPRGLPKLKYWDCANAMAKIAHHSPEGTVICLSEYGKVGAVAPHVTILDPLGLHNRDVAMNGFSADAMLAKKPDLIWLPHPDYVTIRNELMASRELWEDYAVYPAALNFGVAVRTGGPRSEHIQRSFASAWKILYPYQPMEQSRDQR